MKPEHQRQRDTLLFAELPVREVRALGQRPSGSLEEGERELPLPDRCQDRLGRKARRLPCVEEGDPVDVLFAELVSSALQSAQLRQPADVLNPHPRPARYLLTRQSLHDRPPEGPISDANLVRQREVVDAFLAASRGGDFDALVAVLDPDVVLRADGAAARMGASREVRGAAAVADTFSGRARVAQPALVDGAVGAVWVSGGRPRVVFGFTITDGRIVQIDLVADPERLRRLDLAILDD